METYYNIEDTRVHYMLDLCKNLGDKLGLIF